MCEREAGCGALCVAPGWRGAVWMQSVYREVCGFLRRPRSISRVQRPELRASYYVGVLTSGNEFEFVFKLPELKSSVF